MSLYMVMNAAFKIKHWKSRDMQEKESIRTRIESSVPRDPVWHHSANSDPWDRIFYPHLTHNVGFLYSAC